MHLLFILLCCCFVLELLQLDSVYEKSFEWLRVLRFYLDTDYSAKAKVTACVELQLEQHSATDSTFCSFDMVQANSQQKSHFGIIFLYFFFIYYFC